MHAKNYRPEYRRSSLACPKNRRWGLLGAHWEKKQSLEKAARSGLEEAMDKARFLLCCGQGYKHSDVRFHHSNNVCLLLLEKQKLVSLPEMLGTDLIT